MTIEYPYLAASFRLQIDGITMIDFTECTGLAGDIGVEEYLEGGENRFPHRFPSRASMPNLVLKRGATADRGLWDWYAEYARTGQMRPRDGEVLLLAGVDGVLTPVRVWAFRRGWPVKITGPDLNAMSAAVAIESVEIAHHGLSLVPLSV
ncbi:phage tail protein [Streptosporangium sp. NBC_01755]|uniref:phage tail protein n=1 Tax=Streptosporangium sp. NBC_01755 TaxID=2975949 RepID=UPI002DDC864E|nr:phage tail protein [Streptosporangium sp. NBC_01755]WSD01111.1 phage tail protein [Streptosporangium sp. NBC_01755]